MDPACQLNWEALASRTPKTVANTAAVSLTNNTWVTVESVKASATGWYLAAGQFVIAASAAGTFRGGCFIVNAGTTYYGVSSGPLSATSGTYIGVSAVVYLKSGDVCNLSGFQNSGGALLTVIAAGYGQRMTLTRIS